MYVFAVEYGHPESETEVTQELFAKHRDAVDAAKASAMSTFEKDPSMHNGFTSYISSDTNGNAIVVIAWKDGTRAEWWRVVERQVN